MTKFIETPSSIAILGAGSWGTALAVLLGRNKQLVRLWDHDPQHVASMEQQRCNLRYLPDIRFPDEITLFSTLHDALSNVKDVFIVVPSHAFREVLKKAKSEMIDDVRLAWGTKGLDPQSGKLLHEVVEEVLGKTIPMAAIAGPSFAKEVALGLPTAVTLANNDAVFANQLVNLLHNNYFRVYTTDDMAGAEICGAVKNILALAVGVSDGLGLGANARCALITRGLAEMARLGIALNGKRETFMGLAGLGDLVLTATDDQSRNRRLGLALGRGKDIQEALKEIGQVVEGMGNVPGVYSLAKKLHVDMPIVEQVYRVFHENIKPEEAVKALLARDPKEETI